MSRLDGKPGQCVHRQYLHRSHAIDGKTNKKLIPVISLIAGELSSSLRCHLQSGPTSISKGKQNENYTLLSPHPSSLPPPWHGSTPHSAPLPASPKPSFSPAS